MSTVAAFAGNNAVEIDADEASSALRKDCPDLLQRDEKVALAFADRGGKGRDDSFFTDVRVLVRDKQGVTGKKTDYLSFPYDSIKAYSVESSGSGLDGDCTLKMIGAGGKVVSMDFSAKKVDIYRVKRYLNEMVLVGGRTGADAPGVVSGDNSVTSGDQGQGPFVDWLFSDSTQINAAEVEERLKSAPRILLPNETVELAFQCGRDSFLLTSKRLLIIDVQGMSGKRVKYLTVLWDCLRAFSIETAGSFDRDSELIVFTTISGMSRIEMDMREGQADVFAVQKFFADKLLGMDTVDRASESISMAGQADSGSDSTLAWMGDDSRMIDATKMDRLYHSSPPILQGCERVEMAFKGRRDLILFTSKRFLLVDVKGWSGKKVNYVSIPWPTVQAFGVCSAGSFDNDAEMMIWTDINDVFYPPKQNPDDPPPPPIPRNSFLEMDLQKDKVDLMAVHRYLSERCLRIDGGGYLPWDVPVSSDIMETSPPDSLDSFLSLLGNDAVAINAEELNQHLHDGNRVLQEDENVLLAFKAGRDLTVFTTKRILMVDTKGSSGKRGQWTSVPYTSLRAFSVESAGSWDADAEMKLFCKIFWDMNGSPGSKIEQDFRKGKADIIAIQDLLAAHVFGGLDGSSALVNHGGSGAGFGTLGSFLAWIGDDGVQINASEVTEKLRASPPILQRDESVDLCFKVGRDMCIFTTKRILLVDRQGMSGKKVEYKSFPWSYCKAFKVQSAGSLLSSAKIVIYTDVPGVAKFEQELKKCGTDIWAIQTMLSKKLLKD